MSSRRQFLGAAAAALSLPTSFGTDRVRLRSEVIEEKPQTVGNQDGRPQVWVWQDFAEELGIEIGDSVVVERYEDEIAIRPVEE